MAWSKFTKDNITLFKKYKYILHSNNILLEAIKKERQNIIRFIKSYKKFDFIITKLNNTSTQYNNINNNIKSYADGYFVDKINVMKSIKDLNTMYRIQWNNNMIIIKTTIYDFSNIRKRLKLIILMIEYLKSKAKNHNKSINIYLVLTKLNKLFPEDKYMDIKNANSGYTDFSENIIFIWRHEEFEKVLFHELIHLFNLDTRDHNYDKHIDIDGEDMICEAITDFWGIFYHTIYISLISRVQIKLLLELELGFIRNQAMTLNTIYGLDDWKIKPNNMIQQNTSAFSYYIVKYLLFEYSLHNMMSLYNDDPNKMIKEILNNGFIMKPYIKINSSRMTLLQL
jgi:hypothetical protein